ncbi:MAG: hypothetical protein L3J46_01050 [Kangiellaceae bacterium]|nr:hypothetical protein [Kangiellaceae bacterium]
MSISTIYLVHSDNNISTNRFFTLLVNALKSRFQSEQIKVLSTRESPLAQLDSRFRGSNKCIISVDSHSLTRVLATRTQTPIFATNTPQIDLDNQIHKYQQFGVTLSGIYQEQSFARQLMLARVINNELDTAMIILGRKTRYSLNTYQATARDQNMDLSYIILKRNGSPHNFLSNLSSGSQFLVTINDQHHYSIDNLQSLLITSYEKKIPIIGNKAEDTLNAAMASVHTPLDQLALETANELQDFCINSHSADAKEGDLFQAHYSKAFSVSINQQIANHLNYSNLSEEQLFQKLLNIEHSKRN